jgi:large subunit ribosomal protein L23
MNNPNQQPQLINQQQNPYQIIKHIYVTEKSRVLEGLHQAESNPSLRACQNPKYVFIVDQKADKRAIASAIEQIYAHKQIKVVAVNTLQVKGKKRRVRGRLGKTAGFKKAIVTLAPGDVLEDV